MENRRKHLLDDRNIDFMKAAYEVAGKHMEQLDTAMNRDELIAYYIETLQEAYDAIYQAFIDADKARRGRILNLRIDESEE